MILAFLIASPLSWAQSPLRTGVIEQFCLSKYAYSQRLQLQCRKDQSAAVEAYKKLSKQAPYGSGLKKYLQECLDKNFYDANGFDWVAVVACAGEYEEPEFDPNPPNTGPRPYKVDDEE